MYESTQLEEDSMTKRWIWLVIAVALCVAAGARHLSVVAAFKEIVAQREDATATMTVVAINPLTNKVTLLADAADGVSDASAVTDELQPAIESQLNQEARDRLDLYALLVPYRAHVAIHLQPEEMA
jgi:hypothetical protein